MAEKYSSLSPYDYCGSNPINRVDPDGMDWYTDEDGNYHWKKSQEKTIEDNGATYTNVGISVSIQMGEDNYMNFYQNVGYGYSEPVDMFNYALNNESMYSDLIGSSSPLWEQGKQDLFDSRIHGAQRDFMNHPVTQGAINAMTFVAGGGIEAVSALANLGKGFFAKATGKYGKELFNFSDKATKHMNNSNRAVPVQILDQAIKGSKGVIDPRGSRALMHTSKMWKNGKVYNLEVLYDKGTNSIWHFKYSKP